ncbi:MAG: hypothetical protein JKY46_10570 [Robiginitomaculum sp.]|nr:hypothetical protein [Robiginitomaculum sp.]
MKFIVWPLKLFFLAMLISAAARADSTTDFVDRILVSPQTTSVSTGTELQVRYGKLWRGTLKDYQFRLLQLQTNDGKRSWKVVQPFQKYPLPPFKSSYIGPSALQVDIKGPGEKIQMIWIGNYYFHSPSKWYPSLLRAFRIGMFNDDTLAEQFTDVSAKLAFVTAIFTEDERACMTSCSVAGWWAKKWRTTIKESTIVYDSKEGYFEDKGKGVGLNLKEFSHYSDIITTLKKAGVYTSNGEVNIDLVRSVFATQMYYRGYMPGSPTDGYLYSLDQQLSMCNLYSVQLIETLERYGLDTAFISYENEFGGAHAIAQVQTEIGTVVLDAMQGRIYLGSIQDMIAGKEVEAIDLPIYHPVGIDLIYELPRAKAVFLSEQILLLQGQARHNEAIKLK